MLSYQCCVLKQGIRIGVFAVVASRSCVSAVAENDSALLSPVALIQARTRIIGITRIFLYLRLRKIFSLFLML